MCVQVGLTKRSCTHKENSQKKIPGDNAIPNIVWLTQPLPSLITIIIQEPDCCKQRLHNTDYSDKILQSLRKKMLNKAT